MPHEQGAANRPVGPLLRYLVLAGVSLVCFAQYYVYDSITPLGTLIKKELSFSGEQYGLLFSAYSVANVFLLLVIVGGILVDKLGVKLSGLLYTGLCITGAALTLLGASPDLPRYLGGLHGWLATAFMPEWSPELKVMLLGRAIFGVGAESILVVNNKVLARWFSGKELAFAYGLNLTIMRLGTFLAMNLQAPVAESMGLTGGLFLALGIMIAGLGAFGAYLLIERVATKRMALAGVSAPAADERFVLKDLVSFSPSFWFIALLCVSFYSAVFPFQSFAPDILVQRFGYSEIDAARVTSALVLGTMICTPLLGLFVDRRGKRATLMTYGTLLLIPCFILVGFTRFPPIVPIFAVGVALSLVPAALWAAIPMMVPHQRLGTAFGIVGYIQNVGLMLFPFIAGKIADANTSKVERGAQTITLVDYRWTLVLFALLGAAGFLFALMLKRADRRRGAPLELPSAEAEALLKQVDTPSTV